MKHSIKELIQFAKDNGYSEDRITELSSVTSRTIGASQILNANVSIVEKIDLLSGD